MNKNADQKQRAIGLISWLIILSALLACNLPFYIQSTDDYVETTVVKTVNAQAIQEQNEVLPLSPSNTPASNPTPTPIYIGVDYQFVIHQAKSGETLSQYAEQYETSAGAILRVNNSLNLPLWDDVFVVIPVGFTDVVQMPYFQPYKVNAERIALEDLARELATDLEDLRYYNALFGKNEVYAGDWLIIPRKSPGY